MKTNNIILKIVLGLLSVAFILPLYWMFIMALTPNAMLKLNSTTLWPQSFTLENFAGVFRAGLTMRWFLNSVVVTGLATIFTLLFHSMAGYALAKMRFRGQKWIYAFSIAGLMVPKEAMFIPLFLMFSNLQAHNTYIALYLPRIATPLGVFIMVQFFRSIPNSITEAAEIDGSSAYRTFFQIILPTSLPAMTSLGIFTFVLTWNDYLWPLVSATRKEMFTLTTGLASMQGNFAQATELGSLMARGVVACVPLLALFLLFQKNLIRGISISSGSK